MIKTIIGKKLFKFLKNPCILSITISLKATHTNTHDRPL